MSSLFPAWLMPTSFTAFPDTGTFSLASIMNQQYSMSACPISKA